MQIYLAYDGELYDYLEKGNHGDRIRYEPNNQEGIALYEIVLDDNGEKELKEIYEGNVFLNDQREDVITNDDLSDIVIDGESEDLSDTVNDGIEGDIKLIITENNSSEDVKKTKKRSHKEKKRSHKDKKKTKEKKRSKKEKKEKKEKKRSHKEKKKSKKDKKNK